MTRTLETLTTEIMAAIAMGNAAEIAKLAAEINALVPATPVVRKAWDVRVGDKVRGEYLGKTYSGTVTYRRYHTCNPSWLIVSIDLDTPLAIWDDKDIRHDLMLHIDSTGKDETGTMAIC